ncbi:uncharacterized protein CcaverHIS019_0410800 [Cutaneotrichosporon cavernicola]|uniref:Uncharacterized protein n=1 Tax=Cutaneotrichosporon cavernicola TaxID=279322 RepID=A0AA48L5F0_9TREE|nr:uncharacterized protein CcaverHIS019_0410800 [Cutaneotrichosporon cavernicola]BEI92260.1 hypothetical protein CcaverHIS019_0410800 [Cutaneotrichosporon cavernicola]BEJ00032.1 hypothetical protein CcaverHIS631_0410740 [Cutaneotrichosporon cavernicola]BEJ07804.1 hypothetical protein CcaverHIS641_0410730 [Cutaneotrichosporon cavernicola]
MSYAEQMPSELFESHSSHSEDAAPGYQPLRQAYVPGAMAVQDAMAAPVSFAPQTSSTLSTSPRLSSSRYVGIGAAPVSPAPQTSSTLSASPRLSSSRHCPILAYSLPTTQPGLVRTIDFPESPTDMVLLLSALIYGTRGGPWVHNPPPTIAEYLTLHRLYTKYAVRSFLVAMLRHQISAHAYDLAAPLANARSAHGEIFSCLRLAATCRSSRLWDCALKYSRTWQYFVSPWRMDEHAIADVGEEAYVVLLALEAVKNALGESAWTDLRVLYNGEGKPGVTSSRDNTVFWVEDMVG